MKRLLLICVLGIWSTLALAQIPGPPSYTVNGPFPYTPMTGGGQYALAPTSSTALTVPALATYAVICAETATVRYTTSGTTPTSTTGIPLTSGTCVGIAGNLILKAFLAISATGTLDIEYFK